MGFKPLKQSIVYFSWYIKIIIILGCTMVIIKTKLRTKFLFIKVKDNYT